jgi:hypothetical protein
MQRLGFWVWGLGFCYLVTNTAKSPPNIDDARCDPCEQSVVVDLLLRLLGAAWAVQRGKRPPIKPSVKSDDDTSNFDDYSHQVGLYTLTPPDP